MHSRMQKVNKQPAVPIAILDFGSQFTHLISRRLRDAGVYCEIFASDILPDALVSRGVQGVILSGGPSSVYDANCPGFNPEILTLRVPILGICYGYQLMAMLLGGKVVPGNVMEFGRAELITVSSESRLLRELPSSQAVWMSHGDTVEELPPGFVTVGTTRNCSNAAAESISDQRYGIQFHCEVAHTTYGRKIIENFAIDVCHCTPHWSMRAYVEMAEEYIKDATADRNVFILVSGGIDSTVLFILLNRVLGKSRVKGLSIDTGLLRPQDVVTTREFLADHDLDNCLFIDASEEFLRALHGVSDPEQKRKTIGQLFLDIKDKALSDLCLDPKQWILAQGTIYPDIITSGGSKHASVIKTHHNALPSLLDMEVLEPLRFLYKDEVRKLGEELGLPHDFIWKHPFPGPGIGVRIAGQITRQKIDLYHQLDDIVLRHLKSSGWYEPLWMGFPILIDMEESTDRQFCAPEIIQQHIREAVQKGLTQGGVSYGELRTSILPIRSVGVKGDYRTYEHPVEIRVLGADGLRCHVSHDVMETISIEIANRTPHVNRVLLGLRWRDQTDTWKGIVVLRMLLSVDTLTSDWARLDHPLLDQMASDLMAVSSSLDAVLLDITQKPPGTMEWE